MREKKIKRVKKKKKKKMTAYGRLAQEVMTQKSIFTSLFVIGGEKIRVIIWIFLTSQNSR